MAERIRGVFFDLGDTLLNFGHVDVLGLFEAGAQAVYQHLASLGPPMPTFAKYHRRQLRTVRWNYFKSRITQREFDARSLLVRQCRDMGFNLTEEGFDDLIWRWYEPLSRCASTEPDLRATLDRLSEHCTLGLISNTFIPAAALDRHLAQLHLLERLPVRVYSCQVRYRKPHAAIFRLALERAGLAAHEALFVGDSMVADVAGANRAGLISVLKDPTGRHKHALVHPRYRIAHLAELPAIVGGYNGR